MNTILQGKVVCVALNDQQQIDTMKGLFEQAPYQALPTEPVLYFKPHNTWNQSNSPISCPEGSGATLVVGASLALIIDQTCCRVSEKEALNYIKNIALLHDFSLPEQSYYRPDIKGKCIDQSATLSESVPLPELGALDQLVISTSVNGLEKSNFKLSQTVRSAPQLIEKISHIMTLEKGDIIAFAFAGKRIAVAPNDQVKSVVGSTLQLENLVAGDK
ncbi:MAG: fumarylacetoacetate hydrolase family protein [Psychromonas sp.]